MSQLSFDKPEAQARKLFLTDLQQGMIAGHVEKVVFLNPVTGQCLLDVKSEAMKGHFMISGFAPSVHPGQSVVAQVSREVQENEEQVLTATSLVIGPPLLPRTMRKFLRSPAMSVET